MNAFLDLWQHSLIDAIGAALLHFIWQGALVAGLLALVLYIFRYKQPQLKYMLCSAAMLLLFLLPLCTGILIYFNVPDLGLQAVSNQPLISEDLEFASKTEIQPDLVRADGLVHNFPMTEAEPETIKVSGDSGFMVAFQSKLLKWRRGMVIFWMLGLVFFSLRLVDGLLTVNKLKRNASSLQDVLLTAEKIEARFNILMQKMGIAGRVRLYASDQVKQPLLVGWLRPMIILPASLFSGLAPDHIEAILAHELVHIRRNDYAVLLLQSLMETIFFYHPAVWWISAKMRVEREFCCDEEAVEILNNRGLYMRALASLESQRRLENGLALGANGGRLVDRIRYLVEKKRKEDQGQKINRTSWTTFIVLLMASSIMFIACEQLALDTDRPADELFYEANELARAGYFGSAERLATAAAEKGNVCAAKLLAEILYPKIGSFGISRSLILPPVKWHGQSEEKSRYWANYLERELQVMADEGDINAIFLLARMHQEKHGWTSYIDNNDSLAIAYLQIAVDAGNIAAKRHLAFMKMQDDKDATANLFKELALAGDDRSFAFWASFVSEYDDPRPYFEVASIAIDSAATGVHQRFGKSLETLAQQAEKGTPGAAEWLAIADSMRLRERLAELPRTDFPEYEINKSLICPEAIPWRYPADIALQKK